MEHFLLGRQPIFDARLEVMGYELLFRQAVAGNPGGDAMTADVLVRSALDSGLDDLVGGKLAFVNATRGFIVGEQPIPLLSPEKVVVEVLEDVPRDDDVVEGCRRLVAAGFLLALDDYVWRAHDPLLELASFVKLDVLALTDDELATAVHECAKPGVRLLAEKVETPPQMARCQELGFDLFQGYLLSRPQVVEGRALAPGRLTCLRVLRKVYDPKTSARDIEHIVQTDAALSYRFLRAAGVGAARGMFRRVGSVRDALVLLGERRLRAWVALMLLAGTEDGHDEQLVIAMTRARMTELVAAKARAAKAPDGAAFTAGLVSALDLLLGVDLETLVSQMSLSPELESAVLGHEGALGRALGDVLDWELGRVADPTRTGLPPDDLGDCYVQALAWGVETCRISAAAPGSYEDDAARFQPLAAV